MSAWAICLTDSLSGSLKESLCTHDNTCMSLPGGDRLGWDIACVECYMYIGLIAF